MAQPTLTWLRSLKVGDLALVTNITSEKFHIASLGRAKAEDERVKPLPDAVLRWWSLRTAHPLCKLIGGRGRSRYYFDVRLPVDYMEQSMCEVCLARWKAAGEPVVRGWTDLQIVDWPLPFGWKSLPTIGHPWDVAPGEDPTQILNDAGEVVGELRTEVARWGRGDRIVRLVKGHDGHQHAVRFHRASRPLGEKYLRKGALAYVREGAWILMAQGGQP